MAGGENHREKRHQGHVVEDFVNVNFEITKNFYNRDDGENDKEPGSLTQRSVTTRRIVDSTI